jgi:capsular polysaccharide biosynthesis protein
VVNESELEPILARYGFEVVEAENLSLAEQIQLFSQAEAIAGPHGAGLTNIVFAPPGCKVFELFAETCVRPMYYQLADVVGQSYWYLVGTAFPDLQHNDRGFDDMRICPEQFEQTVSRMLKN